MEYGITALSIISLRDSQDKNPTDKSEISDQLLFGEIYKVNEKIDGWLSITKISDSFTGWISEKQHTGISEKTYSDLISEDIYYTTGRITEIKNEKDNTSHLLSKGSIIRKITDNKFKINNEYFTINGQVKKTLYPITKTITEDSFDFLNVPYLWGGKSIMGIDCSGLTQTVYMMNGINLPRNAYEQAMVENGMIINFIDEALPGDLAFFGNEQKITHVGILLGNGQIIHASGKVRIDPIDHIGIFKKETNTYSHFLKLIKRFIY